MLINTTFLKLNKQPILIALASFIFYFLFAYTLERTAYLKLTALYISLFALCYWLLKKTKTNLNFLTVAAFLFRVIFIVSIPNLSQDFYRFIWDGRMLLQGFNPYLYTPESFINLNTFPVAQAQELYAGMGNLNGSHFTNYPPINQLCFVIAGLFTGKSILGSVMVLRLLIIAADLGTLYFGKKLLTQLKLPVSNIFWYILNPFIIIELTGNLHFEGVMIFFLIWSLYLLHKGKWQIAAVIFACSISVKLIPLLFLPLFFKWFINLKTNASAFSGFKKLVVFYCIVGFTTLALFLPFYSSEFINNYAQTVALWFNNFEFNASIYYVAREIGYLFRGYNEIAYIGKALSITVFIIVLCLAFIKQNNSTKNLITSMLFAFTFYLFLSTTVHPWYIATLLILSVFTNYKFPLVWSLVIILSYLAYININKADKSENLWIIGLEYAVVYSVFIWEIFYKKNLLKKETL